MRTILVITRVRPEVGTDASARARAAFGAVCGRPPALHLLGEGPNRHDEVFCSEPEAVDVVEPGGQVFSTVLQQSAYAASGGVIVGRDLLERLARSSADTLRAMAPPFGACFRERPDAPVTMSTDSCGLRHVYHWQGDGWAAASSSSLLLSLVVGAGVDDEALGIFSVIGNHMLELTPYRGVGRLAAGTTCRLHDGRVTVERFGRQVADAPVAGDRIVQGARGVQVMRDVVGLCLDAYPDAGMELSGGFDSRAVLAAIPKASRRGRYALTLGTPGNPDITVATDLARREGLDHQIIDLNGIDLLPAERVLVLARDAALRRDCSANPMGTGVLDWVESQVHQVPRFNGQNAEFGRAHLYPGQRQHEVVTDKMVDTLAKWRIVQNHRTDVGVLRPDFAEAGRELAFASLREQFRRLDTDWMRSLDEYYFQSRMQRWAGIDYTAVGYERVVLSPFFHPAFLEWVRGCDPHDRRASRVFATMFDGLDPELASLPLHLGISPHDVAVGGPRVAVKRTLIGAAQTTSKVWQRVRKVGRASAGADRFAERVVDGWGELEDPRSWLERYGFVDLDGVGQVVRGERHVSSATIAFLVDLEVISRIERDFEQLLLAGDTDRDG